MFKGSIVALITPFDDKGNDDLETYKRLVGWHIEQGTDGILVAGCTGESFTLHEDERDALLSAALEVAKGKIPVIMGTGASETKLAVQRTERAKKIGANAALVITPFGNKPTQEALYNYYREVADVGLPIVMYNVPSRTGTNLLPQTVARLSEIDGIVAIKEASGSVDQMSAILKYAPSITLLSGDDSLTLPALALGAKGVVSTIANIAPQDFAYMVRHFQNGDIQHAREIHFRLYPLMKALFLEGNPVPLKAAMEMLGICSGNLRPPLTPASQKTREALEEALKQAKLIIE